MSGGLTEFEKFKERVIGHVDAARGQCWVFHRWGRWQQVQLTQQVLAADGKWHDDYYLMQRRWCDRCGRLQQHKL